MRHARLPRVPFPQGLEPAAALDASRPTLIPLAPGELFDPWSTFRCGQAFRWRPEGEWYYGPYGRASLAVRAAPDGVEIRATGHPVTAGEAWLALGLQQPLALASSRLSGDRPLRLALAALPGLRILRQDPWECVLGFICSQWNNVPKIELSLERLSRRWGRVHRWPEGVEVASVPSPETLAGLAPEELAGSALGYRCRYVVEAARRVAEEPDLAALRGKPYEEALARVLPLPGIGRKVADCILLYALDQPEAFPVDVWVRRALLELYPRALRRYLPEGAGGGSMPSPREHAALLRFARDRWGHLAGTAQQYLFTARRWDLLSGAQSRRQGRID